MTQNRLDDTEEYRGQNACRQFGADLADAFAAVSSPSFGVPKATRATLTTGLRLRLGVTTGAERLAWLRENREFVALIEVYDEDRQVWVVRWDGEWRV